MTGGLAHDVNTAVPHFDASSRPCRDAQNNGWLTALQGEGPERVRATEELYAYLLRAARSEFARRTDSAHLSGAERDDLIHQAAGDALVSILRRLPDFRGESLFTTWARSFVAVEARVKVRQHNERRTRRHGLGDQEWERLSSGCPTMPESHAELCELNQAVMTALASALTARQRRVFIAIAIDGVSIESLSEQLGANRNAIYQLMFHARRNLRRQLADQGLLEE